LRSVGSPRSLRSSVLARSSVGITATRCQRYARWCARSPTRSERAPPARRSELIGVNRELPHRVGYAMRSAPRRRGARSLKNESWVADVGRTRPGSPPDHTPTSGSEARSPEQPRGQGDLAHRVPRAGDAARGEPGETAERAVDTSRRGRDGERNRYRTWSIRGGVPSEDGSRARAPTARARPNEGVRVACVRARTSAPAKATARGAAVLDGPVTSKTSPAALGGAPASVSQRSVGARLEAGGGRESGGYPARDSRAVTNDVRRRCARKWQVVTPRSRGTVPAAASRPSLRRGGRDARA
jgi:hypothetical protein